MMKRSVLPFLAALALAPVSVLTQPARASVVEALDLATLVREADSVVVARVIKSWVHYDERGRIVTDYQMQVERVEKGNAAPGAAIVVRKLGGVVDGVGMKIAGEAGFVDGEEVLLFGEGDDAILRPVGMSQGAMRISVRDGERYTRSDARGMSLVRRGTTDKSGTPAVNEVRKLEDVLSDVRALVKAEKSVK